MLWENDRDDEALTVLEETAPIGDENRAEAFLLRARILAERGSDEARTYFDKAVDCSPGEPWFYMERANFLLDNGDTDQAGRDLDKAAELLKAGKWNPPDDYYSLRTRLESILNTAGK